MISVQFGIYPLMGIVVAALLYTVYRVALRLKCSAPQSMTYIFCAILATTLSTFISLNRTVEPALSYVTTSVSPTLSATSTEKSTATTPASNNMVEDVANLNTSESIGNATSSAASLFQNVMPLLKWVYLAGILVIIVNLVLQLLWYIRERRQCDIISYDSDATIYSTDTQVPFSFGRSIFIPTTLDEHIRPFVLDHERCHIRHNHFRKLCILQTLLAANWFNPFVWLFFREMKLQQECEVDHDILAKGINRIDYQMSLLKVCIGNGNWRLIQSSFGTKDIKQRLLFMNNQTSKRKTRLRISMALSIMAIIIGGAAAFACQTNTTVRRHPLEGCWMMDFTRPAGSGEEYYPPFRQYAFYNHDTFFTPHFNYRNGMLFRFGFSGEEVKLRNDTLVNAYGEPKVYRFINESTFQSDWKRQKNDNSLVTTEIVTDQWTKASVPDDIIQAFLAAYEADQHHEKPLDGVWKEEGKTEENYLLCNDTLAMSICYVPDTDKTIYRFSGGGYSCSVIYKQVKLGQQIMIRLSESNVKSQDVPVTFIDKDHITLDSDEHLVRVAMPPHIKRMLSTVKDVGLNPNKNSLY